jgi:hypothetical protein
MPITRTIYTQGSVYITGAGGAFAGSQVSGGLLLSGVQSANFSAQTPRQDVNAFGVLGAINKVQVEPSTATLEVTLIANSGNGATTTWLSGLVADALRSNPSGVTVTSSGIGQLTNAVLTSFNLEASVGSIPQLSLTFEGNSGANVLAAPAAPSTPTSQTVLVSTPDNFGTIYWANTSASGCPQSVRASWEMPIERLNCLGNPINSPSIFSRPPGSVSFSAEGIDYAMLSSASGWITGVKIGPWKITASNVFEDSRSANMAVGDAAATFNVESSSTALNSFVEG